MVKKKKTLKTILREKGVQKYIELPSEKGIFRSLFERALMNFFKKYYKMTPEYEAGKIKYTQPAMARNYTPDWILPNGAIIEAKGEFKAADRKKHLLIKDQHPESNIKFIFQNASNTLSKTSKTTYAMWCDKHGFEWVEMPKIQINNVAYIVGALPEEWLK